MSKQGKYCFLQWWGRSLSLSSLLLSSSCVDRAFNLYFHCFLLGAFCSHTDFCCQHQSAGVASQTQLFLVKIFSSFLKYPNSRTPPFFPQKVTLCFLLFLYPMGALWDTTPFLIAKIASMPATYISDFVYAFRNSARSPGHWVSSPDLNLLQKGLSRCLLPEMDTPQGICLIPTLGNNEQVPVFHSVSSVCSTGLAYSRCSRNSSWTNTWHIKYFEFYTITDTNFIILSQDFCQQDRYDFNKHRHLSFKARRKECKESQANCKPVLQFYLYPTMIMFPINYQRYFGLNSTHGRS